MKRTVTKAFVLGLGVIAIVTTGCSKSRQAEQRQAEQQQRQQQAQGQNPAGGGSTTPGPVTGLAEMAKGIEQMGKAAQDMQNQKPVPPVDFKELVALLPDVGGWERTDPEGERMTSPVSYSQAKCSYTKGEAHVEAEITDSGLNQMLVGPMMMMIGGYSKESTSGYEKGTTIAGNPAFEKWNKKDRDAEITVLINKRFIYTLKGRELDGAETLHSFAEKTDLKKLASLH